MVVHPRNYRWSSYGVNAEGTDKRLITPHAEYLALGDDEATRQQRYAELFKANLEQLQLKDIRAAVNGGYALGGERFKAEIAAALGRRVAPIAGGRPPSARYGRDNDQREL